MARCFRVPSDAAPLKPEGHPLATPIHLRFRVPADAAQLKLLPPLPRFEPVGRFRVPTDAAPLKRLHGRGRLPDTRRLRVSSDAAPLQAVFGLVTTDALATPTMSYHEHIALGAKHLYRNGLCRPFGARS